MKRLVLAGGGHAHIEVLRDLAEKPAAGVSCVVVTPHPRLLYTGMVPGVVAGHYKLEECAIGIEALARRAGAQFVQATVTGLDLDSRLVKCDDGAAIAYDALSIDVGARPLIGAALGVKEHATLVRPMEELMKGWAGVLARAREGRVGAITIVGGGAGGVELALAMDHRMRRDIPGPAPHVRVVTNTPLLLPEFSTGARRRLLRRLARRNIGAHVSSTVAQVGPGRVRLESGLEFASDATFWAGGAGAHEWIARCGLATDKRGFLLTNGYLQSVTRAEVFGAGDCATQEGTRFPKAGVFAVRAAPVLAANLRATLAGTPLAPFTTGARYLALVSTGERHAVAAWGGWSWEGGWAWRWKDAIDGKFVAKYS